MNTINDHVTACGLSPQLAGLPTFPARPRARSLDDCRFFSVDEALALTLKAYYAAAAKLSELASENEPGCLPTPFDFACLFLDAMVPRVSAMGWAKGVPCEGLHPGVELCWPNRGDSVEKWREFAPRFLAQIMKCLPPSDNRKKPRHKGAR